MSVLMRGVEMPKNCEECNFKGECRNYWEKIREAYTRPSWCPLVEISEYTLKNGHRVVVAEQTERTHTDNSVRYGTEVSDRKETEMGKTFVEDERPCDSCVNATRYGCVSWNCEYINRDEAIKAWREKHEKADRKTDSNSEKPNNCEDEISAECKRCKHFKFRPNCGWECEYDTFEECNYEPKDEPQTDVYEYHNGEWVKPDCPWK